MRCRSFVGADKYQDHRKSPRVHSAFTASRQLESKGESYFAALTEGLGRGTATVAISRDRIARTGAAGYPATSISGL